MSMPSDTNSDIAEAVEKITPHKATPKASRPGRLTREQSGIAIASLVAFVGVALIGPAMARALQKQKRLQTRVARRARDARQRAGAAGRHAQKRLRKLGDTTFRR